MPSAGREPDRLWQWIEEQKWSSANAPGRRLAANPYSHDSKYNWVQAVSASLRSGRRRPRGARSARKRLEAAIRLSLRSKYPPYHASSPSAPRDRRVFYPIAAVLVLLAALAVFLLLFAKVL